MTTLKQKITAEVKLRELLDSQGMPLPDAIEYEDDCVRLLWRQSKVALEVDLRDLDQDEDEDADENVDATDDDAWDDPRHLERDADDAGLAHLGPDPNPFD